MKKILKMGYYLLISFSVLSPIAAQKSISSPITDGLYRIKVNATGKYWAIENISKDDNARLVQWDYVDQANHKFVVRKSDDGYTIQALHSGKHVDGRLFYGIVDAPVIQYRFTDAMYSHWSLTFSQQQAGGAGWVVQLKKSGVAMRLSGATHYTDNGRHFIIKNPERLDAHDYEAYQTFTFERLGDVPSSFNNTVPRVNVGTSPVKIKKSN
jgi:Ricin-type beta-trefoil lectin domain-like